MPLEAINVFGQAYQLVEKIGAGRFQCYLAQAPDGTKVTAKALTNDWSASVRSIRHSIEARRIATEEGLTKNDVVEYVSTDIVPGKWVLTTYVNGQSLETFKHPTTPEEVEAIRAGLRGLVVNLQALEDSESIHQDIKPEHTIVRAENPKRTTLIDLDCFTQISSRKSSTALGSPLYLSPEALMGEAGYRSDTYSAGVTAAMLLSYGVLISERIRNASTIREMTQLKVDEVPIIADVSATPLSRRFPVEIQQEVRNIIQFIIATTNYYAMERPSPKASLQMLYDTGNLTEV